MSGVDVRKNLRMALQHVVICGPDATVERAIREVDAAVAELIEAAEQAKRAYWLARNSAAGLTNFCEESASVRRCERELSEAEAIWLNAGVDAALARVQPRPTLTPEQMDEGDMTEERR